MPISWWLIIMGHDEDVYLMVPHIKLRHLIEKHRQIMHENVQTSQ
jgi:hypothetical protein